MIVLDLLKIASSPYTPMMIIILGLIVQTAMIWQSSREQRRALVALEEQIGAMSGGHSEKLLNRVLKAECDLVDMQAQVDRLTGELAELRREMAGAASTTIDESAEAIVEPGATSVDRPPPSPPPPTSPEQHRLVREYNAMVDQMDPQLVESFISDFPSQYCELDDDRRVRMAAEESMLIAIEVPGGVAILPSIPFAQDFTTINKRRPNYDKLKGFRFHHTRTGKLKIARAAFAAEVQDGFELRDWGELEGVV